MQTIVSSDGVAHSFNCIPTKHYNSVLEALDERAWPCKNEFDCIGRCSNFCAQVSFQLSNKEATLKNFSTYQFLGSYCTYQR